MRGENFIYSLAIGIAVVCFILATLAGQVGRGRGVRIIALVAAATGIGVAWWWLMEHPGRMELMLPHLTNQRVLISLALLALALLVWRRS